jgi:LPXTG-motif cell wall-anchored protein
MFALFASVAVGQGVVFPVAPDRTFNLADGTSVEQYNGTVQSVRGTRLTVRFPHGERYTYDVPEAFRFIVNGREIGVRELRRGDRLTATVTRHASGGHVLHHVDNVDAPQASVAQVQHAPEPDALPSTASFTPWLALFGALSLGFGVLGFALRRRLA